jgi:hypothetical protein
LFIDAVHCPSLARLGWRQRRKSGRDVYTWSRGVFAYASGGHRHVSGQVNIYVGSSFPAGTNLVYFQFLFDEATAGNSSGYITPLLFEYKPVEAFTICTVVGIGKSFEVKLDSAPQAIPFGVIEGPRCPPAVTSHSASQPQL